MMKAVLLLLVAVAPGAILGTTIKVKSITATMGDQSNHGTDDDVSVFLEWPLYDWNKDPSEGYCVTKVLNSWGNDWSKGDVEKWEEASKLDDCAKYRELQGVYPQKLVMRGRVDLMGDDDLYVEKLAVEVYFADTDESYEYDCGSFDLPLDCEAGECEEDRVNHACTYVGVYGQ